MRKGSVGAFCHLHLIFSFYSEFSVYGEILCCFISLHAFLGFLQSLVI